MKRILEQREYLRLFLTCSREQRNFLITSASRDQLKALEEIAHNVLRSIILLTEEQKLTLRRRVSVIRLLGDPTISYSEKKRRLIGKSADILALLKSVEDYLPIKDEESGTGALR